MDGRLNSSFGGGREVPREEEFCAWKTGWRNKWKTVHQECEQILRSYYSGGNYLCGLYLGFWELFLQPAWDRILNSHRSRSKSGTEEVGCVINPEDMTGVCAPTFCSSCHPHLPIMKLTLLPHFFCQNHTLKTNPVKTKHIACETLHRDSSQWSRI